MLSGPQLVQVGRRAWAAFRADDLPMLAAALAFTTFASLFPLLLFLVAITSLVLPTTEAQAWIAWIMVRIAPQGTDTQFLIDVLTDVIQARGSGTGLAALVSLATLAFTASGMFNALYTAFTRIGGPPQSVNLIRDRALAGLLLLAVVPVLVLSTVVSALLHALEERTTVLVGSIPLLWQGVTLFATLGMLTLVFAVLFRTLPRWPVTWADVWPAALLTAVLWEALKQAFAFYLGHFTEYQAIFGALGGLIGLQAWIFLSAQVLLYGGEVAVAYAAARVRQVLPLPASPAPP